MSQLSSKLSDLTVPRYLLFNKPFNVLSQFTDSETVPTASGEISPRQTLKDFIPIANVYAVGRLDQDSEGLMLLTDDGALQHRLSHPQYQHPRTYWAQVERIPDEAALTQLRQGLVIQDYRTRPAQAQLLDPQPNLPPRIPPIRDRKSIPTAWIELTLTEGRNRQVRRMTAAVGYPTLRLVRVAIAHLQLTGLAPGEWRDLTPEELNPLLRISRRTPQPHRSRSQR